MGNNTKVTIIADNRAKARAELPIAVQKALVAIGMRAERYAKDLCPVDTGRLRNSITYATQSAQGEPNTKGGAHAKEQDYATHGTPEGDSVYIGTNVEYAQRIELGSSKQAPSGFLRPAAQNHGEEYRKLAEAALKSE